MRLRQQHSDAARGQIEAALGAAEARVTASAERLAAHELKVKSQEREILRLIQTKDAMQLRERNLQKVAHSLPPIPPP